MSEYPQPGLHPDPDSLNAFIEGMLPEHERLECLAHLAECAQCREVVYLAQEPPPADLLPVPVADKVSFWKRCFRPIPALCGAAVAGVLVLSITLYQHNKSAANAPELVARAPRAMKLASPPATAKQPPAVSPARPKIAPEARLRTPRAAQRAIQQPETRRTTTIDGTPAISVPPMAPPETQPPVSLPLSGRGVPLIPLPSAAPDVATINGSLSAQSGITGTITDPAGAVIPGATVRLRQLASPASRNANTDASGQFVVAGLEPGRYELQVTAPGFQQTTKQIDIQPEQMARADSILSIGSVSETVSVEAASPSINTESATLAKKKSAIHPLPEKLPADTTVVKGKLMLAADSAGALFLSHNAGKKWKAIKPVWQGKVVGLETIAEPPSSPGAAFQLTTDSGAIWLSRNGRHWYAAPAQR